MSRTASTTVRIRHGPGRDHSPCSLPGPVGPRGDLTALLTQHPADRLDRMALGSHGVDEPHDQRLRGSSSPTKKIVAAFKIASSSSSRGLGLQRLDLSQLLAGRAGTLPPSVWDWITQRRTDSLPTPSCLATAAAAAVSEDTRPGGPGPVVQPWP